MTAGWGRGYDETVWSTKLHVAFLPNDQYQLSCKDESGDNFSPKFMRVTFDGRTYQILNNNNCCKDGWYNMNFARPPPLCSPYVDQGSFQLPDLPLYQHFEAIEFLHHWKDAEVDGIKLNRFHGARYGPVNFGASGESRAVLVHWKSLTSWVRVEMKLANGTFIGSVGQADEGIESAMEIDIPQEVSGIHEVIFTAHRFAGTHYFAKIFSFEILPPLPTTSPSISSALTMSLVPTVTPPTFVPTLNDNQQWFPFGPTLEDIGEITFSVKAGNDAHVALGSAEDQPTGRHVPSHVEIFLGGWGNSRSGIRPATGDVANQVEVGGAYLSRSDYNTFRISWSSTEIKLDHLSLCDRWITMVSMDRSSLDITIDRALVMTGWGSDGEFKLVVDDPSPCPPPPGTYLLACGSSDHWNGDCGGQTAAADTAERHEVRCCKDSVTKPEGGTWNQYAGRGAICANVWGESEDSSGTCQHALHYGEALAMCADLGGRLCTAEELLAECTRGSGCQHDQDMIWSSTEVVPTTQPSNAPTAVPTANVSIYSAC